MRVDELAMAIREQRPRSPVQVHRRAQALQLWQDQPSQARMASSLVAIVELIAARTHTAPPPWTRLVGPLQEPYVLVTVSLPAKLARLRRESPPELRARNLVAPESFLLSA